MSAIKVLVVDDASFVRDLVKRTIRTTFPNITLEEAVNGKKAQGMMNRVAFDLILCDWEMPEMTGMELLKWARQHEAYKKTPFIMVTSRGDKTHVVEAVQEGASDYLGKPFSAEQLTNKIVKALGKKLKGGSQKASSPLQDAFKQSASLLTGTAPKPAAAPKASGSASVLLGGSAPAADNSAQSSVEIKSQNFAEVRFAGSSLKCVIKAVSLVEVKVIAKRETSFPGILDAAVVDIEFEPGSVARLNGYVHQLQAVDKRQDTDFVSIIIRFVDEDPEKIEHLSKFMDRFR
jgi:CheY-like chemotaxis protein